jgi:hypothetical protein
MANQPPPSLFCRIIRPRKEKDKINKGWGRRKKKRKKKEGEEEEERKETISASSSFHNSMT